MSKMKHQIESHTHTYTFPQSLAGSSVLIPKKALILEIKNRTSSLCVLSEAPSHKNQETRCRTMALWSCLAQVTPEVIKGTVFGRKPVVWKWCPSAVTCPRDRTIPEKVTDGELLVPPRQNKTGTKQHRRASSWARSQHMSALRAALRTIHWSIVDCLFFTIDVPMTPSSQFLVSRNLEHHYGTVLPEVRAWLSWHLSKTLTSYCVARCETVARPTYSGVQYQRFCSWGIHEFYGFQLWWIKLT